MKKKVRNLSFLLFVVLIMALSIWGPEALAKYKDRAILDETHEQTVESASEGYRYTLNSNEKLYILSRCLNSQNLPESEQNALTRKEAENVDFPDLEGAYAFVVNHRGPSGQEITDIRDLLGDGHHRDAEQEDERQQPGDCRADGRPAHLGHCLRFAA